MNRKAFCSTKIEYSVRDKFSNQWLFSVSTPYNKYKSLYGYYSSLFKQLKRGAASSENIESSKVKIKIFKHKNESDRMLWEFKSGIVLDCPDDMQPFDWKIILAQLEVMQMGLSDKKTNHGLHNRTKKTIQTHKI